MNLVINNEYSFLVGCGLSLSLICPNLHKNLVFFGLVNFLFAAFINK